MPLSPEHMDTIFNPIEKCIDIGLAIESREAGPGGAVQAEPVMQGLGAVMPAS